MENVILGKNVKKPVSEAGNVLVVGSAGSGKSYCYLEPNIKAVEDSDIVVISPGNTLHEATKASLEKKGYKIQVLDFCKKPTEMSHFNPFDCIFEAIDTFYIARNIIESTDNKTDTCDEFFKKAEEELLLALIIYVNGRYKGEPEKRNLVTVKELLDEIARRNAEDMSEVTNDIFMKDYLTYEDTVHEAMKFWKSFLQNSEETRTAVIASLSARLSFMNIDGVKDALKDSDIDFSVLNLDKDSDEKLAIFIQVPIYDTTFQLISNFVIFAAFAQARHMSLHSRINGDIKRKNHVRFFVDELSNIGRINELNFFMIVSKTHNISIEAVTQDLSQIKALYENETGTILSHMDNIVYMCSTDYLAKNFIAQSKTLLHMDNESVFETAKLNANNCIIFSRKNSIVDEKYGM